ncbi:MAG: hypothetical protein HUJ26_15920 [Planctomycetaceae bacterium]|nr:hypothetical protein [Planctomycetaceae bacterium]
MGWGPPLRQDTGQQTLQRDPQAAFVQEHEHQDQDGQRQTDRQRRDIGHRHLLTGRRKRITPQPTGLRAQQRENGFKDAF